MKTIKGMVNILGMVTVLGAVNCPRDDEYPNDGWRC